MTDEQIERLKRYAVIAGTGHRPNRLGNEYNLDGPISASIRSVCLDFLEASMPSQIISGMALGFDMIWALAGLELEIPVLAAIPFIGQELTWPIGSQRRYHEILSRSERWVVSPGGFNVYKLQHRNERMIDTANLVLACWSGAFGGTRNAVLYAQSIGKPVYRFKPDSRRVELLA